MATLPVLEILREGDDGEPPLRGDLDVESQLLEAAKNGDLDTIKVHMYVQGFKDCEKENNFFFPLSGSVRHRMSIAVMSRGGTPLLCTLPQASIV